MPCSGSGKSRGVPVILGRTDCLVFVLSVQEMMREMSSFLVEYIYGSVFVNLAIRVMEFI